MKYHTLFTKKFLIALLALVQSLAVFAAEAPLKVSSVFDLSSRAHKGTFFELMSDKSNGIKAMLDKDYVTPVKVVDARTFRERASNFAHIKELEAKINGGARGLDKAVSEMAGQAIPVDKMYGTVVTVLRKNGLFVSTNPQNQSRLAGALVPVIAIASGKGVLVRLDQDTYCYNYGYAVGSGGSNLVADELNRKTGRSYGASASRGAYDPSDNDYLRELAKYAAHADERELERFYKTVFEILLKSDSSRIRDLSDAGQTVIADFMAIYMAELDRHLMTGLKKYEWENALTEITMLASFSASEHGVTLDPRGGPSNDSERGLVNSCKLADKDRLVGFFGVGTDGSGLDGRNKQRRHALTRKLVAEQRKLNPALVAKVEKLIGSRSGVDIYDAVMNTINDFRTQSTMNKNADQLIDALVEFMLSTRATASDMNVLTD
ncbi:MAG: hypothetical protein AABZ06_12915 [Bdellovibrionota bacterium]